MVWSNDMTFEVAFVNPKIPDRKAAQFREVSTPDGLYLIANPGEEFQITLYSDDKVNTYAAVVIIDGYKMPLPKNFKRSGRVLGFKHSAGTYRAFKFQRPEVQEFGTNKFRLPQFAEKKYFEATHCTENDRVDYEGGPGEIIVKIYKTEVQEKKPRNEGGGGGGGDRGARTPKEHNDPEFQPFGFNDDKNALDQALGVGFGEIYPCGKGGGGGGGGSIFGGDSQNTYKGVFDETGLLCSFRFFYTDIFALLKKGYINMDYPQHLSLMPAQYFKDNKEGLIHALQTIVRGSRAIDHKGCSMEEIVQRCRIWLRFALKDVLGPEKDPNDDFPSDGFAPSDEELIITFFNQHNEHFIHDQTSRTFRMGKAISKRLHMHNDMEDGEI